MIAASLMLEKLQVNNEVDVFQAVQRVRIAQPELVTSLVRLKAMSCSLAAIICYH